MEYKKMLITPSIAKQMLEANTENRILKPKIVAKYAKEMSEGKWMYPTGEVIKICTDGTMLDAQHRLHAVIKSNTNQYFDVALGLDREVFSVLDTGLKRNSPDCFYIRKIAYSSILPSIIGNYIMLKNGYKNYRDRPTNTVLLIEYDSDVKFWNSVAVSTKNWVRSFASIIPASLVGGLYSHFYKISPKDAELFFTQLCTGKNIENKSIDILRTRLIKDKTEQRKVSFEVKMAYIIKCWNYYRIGTQAKILKYDDKIESFPIAK